MSIEVKGLLKTFGTQHAVDHISFSVAKGDILGFLGPNGAGKSTTMKVATGYIPATAGSVEVCGIDVSEQPLAVKQKIGYLPEQNPLYLDMYVHEYLGFIGSVHGLKGAKLKDRVQEMVQLTGLTREQNKKLGMLSKGYRQRVGLAQALIHNPEVVILDEPTSGLDPNQIIEIRELIKSVSKEKTMILSTHIMQEVKAVCNRAVIINLGKIVADSPIAELGGKSKGKQLVVEFADDVVSAGFFESIPMIIQVQKRAPGLWVVSSDHPTDARAAIFAKAAQEKLNLIGLREEESSLEKIFQQLTKSSQ